MRRKSIGVVGSSSEVMMKLALIGVVLLAVIWFIIPAVWRPQSENIEQATSSHNLRDANCKVQSFLQGGLDSDRDGVTDSCDVCLGASEKDKDGDGVPEGDTDCDDFHPQIHSYHVELFDGIDNDCDGG